MARTLSSPVVPWCLMLPLACGAQVLPPAPPEMPPPVPQAQVRDTLTVGASYSLQHDSNLFRLPDGADTQALLGRDSGAERIGITTLSLDFDKSYSLQRLQLGLSAVDHKFQRFGHLDFTAYNYDAAWRWSLTPRLRGNLIAERTQTLNSFADQQNFSQGNRRTNTRRRFDADYDLDGTWHVFGGLTQTAQDNLQQLLGEDDTRLRSVEMGLRREFASGSTASYALRRSNGDYLHRELSPVEQLDDRFSQLNHDFRLHWLYSEKTTMDFLLSAFRREHPHFGQRDFSGVNAQASLKWRITGKTTLNVAWARDFASYQTATSNYARTDRWSIGPAWQATAKTALRLRYGLLQRHYLGAPAGAAPGLRRDTIHEVGLALDWKPRDPVSVSTSLERSTRSSTSANLGFDSTRLQVTAQFSF